MTPEETNRFIELVDRVIGLENQLAVMKIQVAAKTTNEIRSSKTYKVGHFILSPIKFFSRLARKLLHG